MNYTEYKAEIEQLLVIDPATQPEFETTILPLMITYSENRILADLDLLSAKTTATVAMTANSRNVTPPPTIQIIESASAIYPGATNPDSGTRYPMQRASTEFINFTWPSASTNATAPSIPQYYALTSVTTCIVSPTPDAAYKMEFVGTYRPDSLAVGTPTTWISTNLPELFIAASMSFGAGYQRDFGAQGPSDPGLSVSWENQYSTLLKSQSVQMARQRAQSEAWQAFTPAPLARTPRT